MKDTHVLYAVGILVSVAITACFVGYATHTLPTHTLTSQASATLHGKTEAHRTSRRHKAG